jgi:glycosyltransferase involved in cell wall biosynthesis
MASSAVHISIVIPVFNEEGSLALLHGEIAQHVGGMGRPWEVLYIDDHSTDSTPQVLRELGANDPHIRTLRFSRNFGQTAAMAAGFEHALGEVVVTLDADLQNYPADIPRLIAELESGFDIVAGWRKDRQDGFVLRRLPSIMANRLVGLVTGVTIHDTGCTLKAFRRELVDNLPIYAEQHRFLPVLSMASGARMSELVVNHRPRIYGTSKYGIGRATRVLLDLLTVKMISSFSRRPLQYFAFLAVPFALASGWLILSSLWSLEYLARWSQSAILIFMLLAMTCVYFLLLGLLAELVVKASDAPRRSFGALSSEPRS